MESSAGGHRGLLAAAVALINLSHLVETGLLAFALRAAKPIRPAHLYQVLPAALLGWKTPLKVN